MKDFIYIGEDVYNRNHIVGLTYTIETADRYHVLMDTTLRQGILVTVSQSESDAVKYIRALTNRLNTVPKP